MSLRSKRIACICIALAALISILPGSTFAQEGAQAPETEVAQQALPADMPSLLALLPDADFDAKKDITTAIAESDEPRAGLILKAMADGNLYVRTSDKKLLVGPGQSGSGIFTDALTGETVAGITNADVDTIVVNNRLRRDLRGLTARLALTSPDVRLRRTAAEEALAAKDPASLPAIDLALASEKNPSVKASLEQAKAAITLNDSAASDEAKIAAVAVLEDRGDSTALNVLMGLGPETSAPVQASAKAAQESIQDTLAYWSALQNVWYGLSLGSVLLLAAIGLAITFGVMGVINMAHGEMIMLGAYTTYVVQQIIGEHSPGLMEWSLAIAVPSAFMVSGLAGIAVERSIIRFLYQRPLETLLATWGLSLVLQQMVRTIFGPTNREVITPQWMSGSFGLGGLDITYSRMWIIVFALTVLAALMVFLKRTQFGLEMRAVTQNRRMASAMGIRTDRVDAFTFGLGSGIAGIAGVALSQIDNVSPNLGQSYIIDSFMVVVFGGVGNLWGALVGAMTLGAANKFLEPYAGAVLGKILVLIFIILFIQRRPRGLFALKGRSVEA